jgi:hypothetical protein
MPWVEFEPTNSGFERAKAVHSLDRAATLIGKRLVFHHAIFQRYVWKTLVLKKQLRPSSDIDVKDTRLIGPEDVRRETHYYNTRRKILRRTSETAYKPNLNMQETIKLQTPWTRNHSEQRYPPSWSRHRRSYRISPPMWPWIQYTI